mmetsp:Transcript_56251/g.164378  ORF Transcript_56251/g.164378 Transcript_56251/m.164378 type:complete len:277 (-) Transcript_56251:146-976(-)
MACTLITAATSSPAAAEPTRRSWAQIVKGADTAPSESPAASEPLTATSGQEPGEPRPSTLSAGATEFVPTGIAARTCGLSVTAEEFVPSMSADAEEFVPSMSADAEEFTPHCGPSSMSCDAPEFVPQVQATSPAPWLVSSHMKSGPSSATAGVLGSRGLDVWKINAAYFSDSDDDSEDEGAEGGDEASSQCSEGEHSIIGSEGDLCQQEDFPSVEVDDELDVVVMCAPLKAGGPRATSPDGSTSAGESDSEEELPGGRAPLCSFRMPPGLSVLPGR